MGRLSVSSVVVTMLSAALSCREAKDVNAAMAQEQNNYIAPNNSFSPSNPTLSRSLQSTLIDVRTDFVYNGSTKPNTTLFPLASNLALPNLTSSRCSMTSMWASRFLSAIKSGRRKKKLKNKNENTVLFPLSQGTVLAGKIKSVADMKRPQLSLLLPPYSDQLEINFTTQEVPSSETFYSSQSLNSNDINSSVVPSRDMLYQDFLEENITEAMYKEAEEINLTLTTRALSTEASPCSDNEFDNVLTHSSSTNATDLGDNVFTTSMSLEAVMPSDKAKKNNSVFLSTNLLGVNITNSLSETKYLVPIEKNASFHLEHTYQGYSSTTSLDVSVSMSSKARNLNESIYSGGVPGIENLTEMPVAITRTPLPRTKFVVEDTCITTRKPFGGVSQPSTSKLIREEDLNADASTRSILKQTRDVNRTKFLEGVSEAAPTSEMPRFISENEEDVENRSALLEIFKQRYPIELWKTKGFFKDDFYDYIHTHWLKFPPPDPSSFYILAAAYCAIMTIGIIGNSLVIFMFIRCRSLRTPANILVMNLAVSDFVLMSKMPLFIYNCLYRGPVLGYFGCQVFGFVGGLTGTVSIATLAAISLDRYYVIVCPLDAVRRTTKLRARLCVIFSWLYGGLFSSLPLAPSLGFGTYVPEGFLTSCSFDYLDPSASSRIYIFVFFVAAWVLPFCIITTCYVGICRVVASARANPGKDSGRHEKNRTEMRLAIIVFFVIGLWFLAWTPYAVVALLGIARQKQMISPLSSMVPAIFCKTASCVDPYVYAVTHPRFRLEFATLVGMRVGSQRVKKDDQKRKIHKVRMKQTRAWTVTETTSHPHSEWSDVDVEEVDVIVGGAASLSSLSSEEDRERRKWTGGDDRTVWDQAASVFPMTEALNRKYQPPSWFVAPKPQRDRSTSLKYKMNENSRCPKSV